MKFKHNEGENAAGQTMTVAPRTNVEVDDDGLFEVTEETLEYTDVEMDDVVANLQRAGHRPVDDHVEPPDGESDEEDVEDEGVDEEEAQDDEEDVEDAATEEELLQLEYNVLQKMAGELDDVSGNQSQEDLAGDLAGRVKLEDPDEGDE